MQCFHHLAAQLVGSSRESAFIEVLGLERGGLPSSSPLSKLAAYHERMESRGPESKDNGPTMHIISIYMQQASKREGKKFCLPQRQRGQSRRTGLESGSSVHMPARKKPPGQVKLTDSRTSGRFSPHCSVQS